jgi:hypothetical protein
VKTKNKIKNKNKIEKQKRKTKQKNKTKKQNTKHKTGPAAIEPRTSSRPDKMLHQFSHGDGYPTVTQRL